MTEEFEEWLENDWFTSGETSWEEYYNEGEEEKDMKNITRHTGKIKLIERLKNSENGNPQFILGVFDYPEKGLGWTFRTPKDSMLGYKIKNYIDRDVDVTVTIGTHYGVCTLNSIEA